VLVGGWTIAASRQPAGYNPIRNTISSLAALGAADRWLMTSALGALGISYAVTGLGLRALRPGARTVLVGGGLATLLVAVFPQPHRGNSIAHTVAATLAFAALALWPLFTAGSRSTSPVLSRTGSGFASAVMCGLLVWFALEIHGSHRGLAERSGALAEAVWPAVVAASLRTSARRLRCPSPRHRAPRRRAPQRTLPLNGSSSIRLGSNDRRSH